MSCKTRPTRADDPANVTRTVADFSHFRRVHVRFGSSRAATTSVKTDTSRHGMIVVCLLKTEPVRSSPVNTVCRRERPAGDRIPRNVIVPATTKRLHAN